MRIIAHFDMDAFYAAVEERVNPRLRGRPLVVGADPKSVTATYSYFATESNRAGTVFAIASELESEGLVVLEAAACGLPIVAVRATSMPELVEQNGCGYLVPPGDIHAMAERIVAVLRDPAAGEVLGRAALEMARQHSLEITLDRHEAMYQSLLESASMRLSPP